MVKLSDSVEHSSLLWYRNNGGRKKFYCKWVVFTTALFLKQGKFDFMMLPLH